jgi:hypothetical protein
MLDPLRNGDGKKNRDLAPPPRAKFLHFRPSRSPAMQEHMAEVVYPMAEVVKPTLDPNRSQGELEKSQSQGDFAWGSDRIAHELAHKLDQFTWRPEDGVRKLLWTLGTDHSYESKSRNSISVTPKNLTGLCNRFGLACNDGQAHRRRFLHAHTHYLLPTPLPHARHLPPPLVCSPLLSCTPFPMYALPLYPTPHPAAAGGTNLRAPPVAARRVQRAHAVDTLAQPTRRHGTACACGGAARARQPLCQQHAIQLRAGPAHAQNKQGGTRPSRTTLQWPVCSPRPSSPRACPVAGRTRSRWPSCPALCLRAGSHKAQARPRSHEARARPHSTADPRRVLGARLRCARRVGGERNRCAPLGRFS